MPNSLRIVNRSLQLGWIVVAAVAFVVSSTMHHNSVDLARAEAAGVSALATSVLPAIEAPPTMMVIGDSYTTGPDIRSRYHNDVVGSERRGWWSFLADYLHYKPVLSAEPGSGMLKGGRECEGTTYGDRLDEIKKVDPDLLIIEGGRNDFTYCSADTTAATGEPVTTYSTHMASAQAIEVATRDYMKQVRATIDDIGLSPERVYVMTPWGASIPDKRALITDTIAKQAKEEGFAYVDVPPFSGTELYDETHPNGVGSKDMFKKLLKLTDIGNYRVK